MTSKKSILVGLAAALAIIAYCTIGMAAENWVMRYVQRTLHYAPAVVFRVVYALAGALLIRIGWELAKGKRPRGGLTIAPAAVWALAGLAVFAAVGVYSISLRPAVWNHTYLICLWTAALFCVKFKS